MRIAKHVGVALVLLLLSVRSFSQQLRLGKSPLPLQKSAILELESDNQGLLFPRIVDTALINTLAPVDGMVIFHQPTRQLMVRSNGFWRPFVTTNNLALSRLSDVTITTPANGQLLQYNGTRWVNSTPSYLTSIDTGNITNFHQKVRRLISAGTGISYNNATGVISNSGITSVNGNTGAITLDTGYISNFYQKTRSLFSAGTGITYNAATGVISSSLSTAGLWSLTGNANTVAGTSFLGTTDDKPLILKSNNSPFVEMGTRSTLGLVQGYTDYTDGTEQVLHMKS
ncbi:MAG: hypothetical protein EOO02_07605, partial [Chitinophagaceae bacterium]